MPPKAKAKPALGGKAGAATGGPTTVTLPDGTEVRKQEGIGREAVRRRASLSRRRQKSPLTRILSLPPSQMPLALPPGVDPELAKQVMMQKGRCADRERERDRLGPPVARREERRDGLTTSPSRRERASAPSPAPRPDPHPIPLFFPSHDRSSPT